MAKLVFSDGMNSFLEFSDDGSIALKDYMTIDGVVHEATKTIKPVNLSAVAEAIINLNIAAQIDEDFGAIEALETMHWENFFFPNVIFQDADYKPVQ